MSNNSKNVESNHFEQLIGALAFFLEPEWFAEAIKDYTPAKASGLYAAYLESLKYDPGTIDKLTAGFQPFLQDPGTYFTVCKLVTRACGDAYSDPPCETRDEFLALLGAVRASPELKNLAAKRAKSA